MKKITITLALLLGCFFNSFTQTTAIPDANFEQALVTQGIDTDGVVNGVILTADAVAVTGTLNVNNNAIADLTGIEAFTSIERLEVRDNALTSLDLTALTGLLRLEAGGNSLTSVNVNGLTSLERLIVPDNALTSVDLTGLTNLRYLYAYNNDISTLDLTDVSLLQRLYVFDNINLGNYNTDNLTILDRLRAWNTAVTALDLSQNVALQQVRIYDNTSLESVNIQNGANTNLGTGDFQASGNTTLNCVRVDDVTYSVNTWTDIDDTSVYSTNCALSVEDFEGFVSKLYPNPTSDYLSIEVSKEASYIIYDLIGNVAKSGTINIGASLIDVKGLSSGMYLISLTGEDNRKDVLKFLKH